MRRYSLTLPLLAFFALLLACRLQPPAEPDPTPLDDPWVAVRLAIDESDFDEITVIVGDRSGNLFSYSKGPSSPDKAYELASASKWLSSAVIMRLVEAGALSLDDHPQDFIPWWTDDPNDPRSGVTLAQLLSFTAGFDVGPFEGSCVSDGDTTLDACGQELYGQYFEFLPGTNFYYGPANLHTAALIAQYATGKDYNMLFQEQIAGPLGLSAETGFFRPSAENPRAAGGASSTANDYARFLQALLAGEILSDSFDLMTADHTPSGEVAIAYSPVTRQGFEWHYGFGEWRECPLEAWEAECDQHVVVSSPGAFGWYPWIDVSEGYYALVAVQERLGLVVRPSEVSVEFGLALRPLIEDALDEAYRVARSRHLRILREDSELGTYGELQWTREDLHDG